jgi:hypothetical protein
VTQLPFGEQIIRLRATPAADPYSGVIDQLDWSTPSRLVIDGCGVAPTSSTEPLRDNRSEVISRIDIYVPYGADIRALDRLVVAGVTWHVDGDPAAWRSPLTGWAPGAVVSCTRVEG